MENRTQPAHCSVPLSSRLDHLDFIMKCLEGKRGLGPWGRRNQSDVVMERPLLPSDSACYKGPLLERVTSLENRLFQLCLELESSGTSSTSTTTTTITSGYASSSGSKGETFHHSLPTFQRPNLQLVRPDSHQAVASKSQVQGSDGQQIENEISSNKQKKTSKSVKKKASSKWPHFKLLGC